MVIDERSRSLPFWIRWWTLSLVAPYQSIVSRWRIQIWVTWAWEAGPFGWYFRFCSLIPGFPPHWFCSVVAKGSSQNMASYNRKHYEEYHQHGVPNFLKFCKSRLPIVHNLAEWILAKIFWESNYRVFVTVSTVKIYLCFVVKGCVIFNIQARFDADWCL